MATCERCGVERRTIHRHHVVPRCEGGRDADGILMLCANCHEDAHGGSFYPDALEKRAAARRASRPVGRQVLHRLYVEEGLGIRAIAEQFGTAASNIQFWLADYEIPRRKGGRPKGTSLPPRVSAEELREMYVVKGMSQAAIADLFGVSQVAVSNWMKRNHIPVRTAKTKTLKQAG